MDQLTRETICANQLAKCVVSCQNSAVTNTCNSDTLEWQCTCPSKTTKKLNDWQLPVPFKLCRRDLWQCILTCGSVYESKSIESLDGDGNNKSSSSSSSFFSAAAISSESHPRDHRNSKRAPSPIQPTDKQQHKDNDDDNDRGERDTVHPTTDNHLLYTPSQIHLLERSAARGAPPPSQSLSSVDAAIVEKDQHRLLQPAPAVHKSPACIAACQTKFACGTQQAPMYRAMDQLALLRHDGDLDEDAAAEDDGEDAHGHGREARARLRRPLSSSSSFSDSPDRSFCCIIIWYVFLRWISLTRQSSIPSASSFSRIRSVYRVRNSILLLQFSAVGLAAAAVGLAAAAAAAVVAVVTVTDNGLGFCVVMRVGVWETCKHGVVDGCMDAIEVVAVLANAVVVVVVVVVVNADEVGLSSVVVTIVTFFVPVASACARSLDVDGCSVKGGANWVSITVDTSPPPAFSSSIEDVEGREEEEEQEEEEEDMEDEKEDEEEEEEEEEDDDDDEEEEEEEEEDEEDEDDDEDDEVNTDEEA
ncbi:hypothetical protein DFQ26_008453 [Actinomortierella ambigua]|nr:hypothetical protein DFQ26_008453 [Actinomortierella ambigua]